MRCGGEAAQVGDVRELADRVGLTFLADDLAAWRGPRGYVDNVAHAIALAATSSHAVGRIYNICEEPTLSELEWLKTIAAAMNWKGNFVVLPRSRTPAHLLQPGNAAQHVVCSAARIRTELGFEQPITTTEAVRRTIAWEQSNPPTRPTPHQFDYPIEDAAVPNN